MLGWGEKREGKGGGGGKSVYFFDTFLLRSKYWPACGPLLIIFAFLDLTNFFLS